MFIFHRAFRDVVFTSVVLSAQFLAYITLTELLPLWSVLQSSDEDNVHSLNCFWFLRYMSTLQIPLEIFVIMDSISGINYAKYVNYIISNRIQSFIYNSK